MNKYVIACLSTMLFMSFALFQNVWASPAEVEPVSKIQSVVVFTDSAMIKKEARFPVRKGENIVRISGITPYLVDQSVQVSISAKSAVKISEIKVENTALQKTPQEKIQKLQAKLDALDESIKKTSNEVSVITSSNEFLKKVQPFSQNQKVMQAEVEAHARFLEKALAENYERMAKAELRLKKLQEEKGMIEKEMKGLRTSDKSKTIEIALIAQDDTKEVALAFSYVVNNTGWAPLYEVRADSNTSKIDMGCFATIKQATGEDWKEVQVEISTAKPYNAKAPSGLTAWHVDVYQPKRYSAYQTLREEAAPSISKSAMSFEPERHPFEEAQVKADTTSFSFVIPRKISIPSDNQPHRVLIAASEKKTEFAYYAVPKLSKFAYLKADLKNPFAFTLLPGRMNIFLDGRLVGASSVEKTIIPDEEMKLSLGIDEAITVERKLQKKLTGYSGLFTKGTKITYEYAHEITNGKGKEIPITISDNFPVSLNEKIKVSLEAPKKEEADISADGIILWKVKLAAGEKKSLPLKFRVEHPKELKVTGLE